MEISDILQGKDIVKCVQYRPLRWYGQYVEIKCQLDATEVFIADLIACSTCFGHHYAHHQELKSITFDVILTCIVVNMWK